MLILSAEMWNASIVSLQLQIGKLWYRHSQRIPNPAKSSLLRLVGGSGNLLEKVPAVWVIVATDRTVRLPHELGHDVQVPDGLEEGRHLAKRLVDIHLLEVCLRQALLVLAILLVGAIENRNSFMEDNLPPDNRALGVILIESQLVFPFGRLRICTDSDPESQLRASARGKRAKPRDAASGADGLLEPPSDSHNVMKEPEGIQEVRLPGGIRADKKGSSLEIDAGPAEITPIFHMKVCDSQCPPARILHAAPQSRKRTIECIWDHALQV